MFGFGQKETFESLQLWLKEVEDNFSIEYSFFKKNSTV